MFSTASGRRTRRRSSQGAGLGLAIVAAVAAEHDGSVNVANTPDGGAVFTVRLPLVPSSSGTPNSHRDRGKPVSSRERQPEAVADAADGVDQRRSGIVDLVAQVADVGLQHAGVAGEGVVPHVLEDLVPGEHPAGVDQQVVEQLVLGRRQLDQAAGPPDVARVLVELEVGVSSGGGRPARRRRTGAARPSPARSAPRC